MPVNNIPILSIVIPAYNAGEYIGATLDSVLSQTWTDFEVIIVNDCSTDNTLHVVRPYIESDERFRLIDLDENMGAPAGPRNIGIKTSRGKWIAFLDSDDVWHFDKLRIQMDVIEKTSAKFCSTQMVNFAVLEDIEFCEMDDQYETEWISLKQQLIKFRTPTSSVIVERNLIEGNLFNEDLRYKAREDLDCWLRCHEVIGKSVKVKLPLLAYRIVPGQISGSKWIMIRRHLFVLWNFKRKSGKELKFMAVVYTATHFAISLYFRLFKRGL